MVDMMIKRIFWYVSICLRSTPEWMLCSVCVSDNNRTAFKTMGVDHCTVTVLWSWKTPWRSCEQIWNRHQFPVLKVLFLKFDHPQNVTCCSFVGGWKLHEDFLLCSHLLETEFYPQMNNITLLILPITVADEHWGLWLGSGDFLMLLKKLVLQSKTEWAAAEERKHLFTAPVSGGKLNSAYTDKVTEGSVGNTDSQGCYPGQNNEDQKCKSVK